MVVETLCECGMYRVGGHTKCAMCIFSGVKGHTRKKVCWLSVGVVVISGIIRVKMSGLLVVLNARRALKSRKIWRIELYERNK